MPQWKLPITDYTIQFLKVIKTSISQRRTAYLESNGVKNTNIRIKKNKCTTTVSFDLAENYYKTLTLTIWPLESSWTFQQFLIVCIMIHCSTNCTEFILKYMYTMVYGYGTWFWTVYTYLSHNSTFFESMFFGYQQFYSLFSIHVKNR